MKELLILRGVSGCGKSTLAHKIADVVCEADEYFTVNGVYNFDQNELHAAHNFCRTKCESAMKSGVEIIAVSNTSTTERELSTYIHLAELYGYVFTVLVVENRNNTVNGHNVHEEVLMRQKHNLEKSIKLM